jgi:hypothetical protein
MPQRSEALLPGEPRYLHSNTLQSTPQAESEYSLFSGGVTGKYVSLDPPRKIVQTWSLQSPTWPSGALDSPWGWHRIVMSWTIL